MSLEEDILIERFLKNELSETEKNKVLESINSDALFREKVLFEQQLFDTLDENSWSFAKNVDTSKVKEFENLFKSEEIIYIKKTIAKANENFKKKKKNRFKKWQIYSSAAIVALLISVYALKPQNLSTNEIYTKFINSKEIPSIINRGNEKDFKKLVKGQRYFENKEYSKSAALFSSELKNNLNNSNVYILLALSQIEIDDFKNAEITLDSLLNSNLIDAQKSYWYKSLLYIKSNQIEKARNTLSILIKNSYYKNKQAIKLLEEIVNQ